MRNAKKQFGHCWIWKGSFSQSGYGRHYVHQKSFRAHRFAFMIYHGAISDDSFVCHKCDNPACVNPQHLFLGSPRDNTHDMIRKGRLNRSRGQDKGVSYRKETGKWRARYMNNYKSILVGEFETQEEALQALRKAREAP